MTEIHKLAIFFDGTWNTIDYPSQFTNVKKIKELVVSKYRDGEDLYLTDTFYIEGPGTHPGSALLGAAFATDLNQILQDAYIWVSQAYLTQHQAGFAPELYIFGFSRGAYLAHIFTWLLNDIGITTQLAKLPKLITAYMHHSSLNDAKGNDFSSIRPVVRMLGVFDMVSAPLDFFSKYRDGEVSPVVTQVYHAMSLDERRPLFPVLKYHQGQANVKQTWFSGVHSDVGGGYPDSTLANFSLNWMLDNAIEEDLILKECSPSEQPRDAFLTMEKHDEAGNVDRCRVYEKEEISDSVYRRIAMDASYHPSATNFPVV